MSARDIQLRRLILLEFRASNTTKTALKNIRAKLGPDSITSSKIHYWYNKFKAGNTSIGDGALQNSEVFFEK